MQIFLPLKTITVHAVYHTFLLQALQAVHMNGVHRDVKPGNILLDYSRTTKDMRVTLSDFGSSADLVIAPAAEGWETRACGSPSPKGTLHYMAPERLQMEPSGTAADVWSLGMTIATLANNGVYPLKEAIGNFERVDIAATAVVVLCGAEYCCRSFVASVQPLPVSMFNLIAAYQPSTLFKSFLAEMLHENGHERSSVLKLQEHTFLSSRIGWAQSCPQVVMAAVVQLERTRDFAAVRLAVLGLLASNPSSKRWDVTAKAELACHLGMEVVELQQCFDAARATCADVVLPMMVVDTRFNMAMYKSLQHND
jgi:serine/threonine protein kinase